MFFLLFLSFVSSFTIPSFWNKLTGHVIDPSINEDMNLVIQKEAESFDKSIDRVPLYWGEFSNSTFPGIVMRSARNASIIPGPSPVSVVNSSELSYAINFPSAGIYYVWVKSFSFNVSDNSVRIGLDGRLPRYNYLRGFNEHLPWTNADYTGSAVYLNITRAGVHNVSFWARTDEFIFDSFILTKNATYLPPQPSCTPNWDCTEWSECSNNQRTRSCVNLNNCVVDSRIKAAETQTCALDNPENFIVTREAENAEKNFYRYGGQWVIINNSDWNGGNYSNGYGVQLLPNIGRAYSPNLSERPELDYTVNFPSAGTYYLIVRGASPTNHVDQIVHAGLDYKIQKSSTRIGSDNGFRAYFKWVNVIWGNVSNGYRQNLNITVPSAGNHVVSFWVADDGFVFDKFIITNNYTYAPTGFGPNESLSTSVNPTSCTLLYSNWNACTASGIQTRTVIGSIPSGCSATPDTSRSCTYTPLCTDSNWQFILSSCVNNEQNKTWTKVGTCTGGVDHPTIETITCVSTPACTELNWQYTLSPTTCPSSATQTKTWTKVGTCTGGITHSTETVSCTYIPPTCVFGYSAWSSCTNGNQTRTVTSTTPSGCTGGTTILIRPCTVVPGPDSDGDGIVDTIDRCPATLSTSVNVYGCPKPNSTRFDITNDFDNSDLSNISNFIIGIRRYGKIEFGSRNISLLNNSLAAFDLDSNINISNGRVEIRSNVIPALNRSANITLYNISVNNPKILIDGNECRDCIILSWDSVNKTLIFSVFHFTTYEVTENTTSTSNPQNNNGNGANNAGGGGGSSPSPSSTNQSNLNTSAADLGSYTIPDEVSSGQNEITENTSNDLPNSSPVVNRSKVLVILIIIIALIILLILSFWYYFKSKNSLNSNKFDRKSTEFNLR